MNFLPLVVIGLLQLEPISISKFSSYDTAVGLLKNKKLNMYCSGFFVAPKLVLTANHCVYSSQFSDGITLETRDKTYHCGELVYSNRIKDIATLRCDESVTNWIPISDKYLTPNSEIYVLHHVNNLKDSWNFVSPGRILSVHGSEMRHNADTFPGSSGGAIIDSSGGLIGIHTSGRRFQYNVGTLLIKEK